MFSVKRSVLAVPLTLFMAGVVYAVPIKGPYFLKNRQFEAGFESNIVLRRDIDDIATKIKSSQFFYCMSYGLFDWLNIEGKFGTGDVAGDQYSSQKFYYNYNWGGGYGLRIKAYENKKVKFILGCHHISIHPDANKNTDSRTHKAILDETQFDATAGLKGERFSPYLGVKAGLCRLIRRIDTERATLRSEENYGFALGFDYMLKNNLRLNAESRFVDEYALTCGLNYIF